MRNFDTVALDRWLTTPPDEYGFEADYASACAGLGCVDGCADCVGCEWCFITHDIQNCPAIRAELMKEGT